MKTEIEIVFKIERETTSYLARRFKTNILSSSSFCSLCLWGYKVRRMKAETCLE